MGPMVILMLKLSNFTHDLHASTAAEHAKRLTLDPEEVGSNPGGLDILVSPHFDSLPIFTRSPQKVGPKGGTKKWDQKVGLIVSLVSLRFKYFHFH